LLENHTHLRTAHRKYLGTVKNKIGVSTTSKRSKTINWIKPRLEQSLKLRLDTNETMSRLDRVFLTVITEDKQNLKYAS